jgi:ATP-dependent Lon protease
VSTIDQKLRRVFPDEVVNKRLSRTQQLDRLPKFISEYAARELVGESEDPGSMAVLSNFVKQFYPEPKDKDRVLHEIMTRGEYTLLDEFKVRVDPKRGLRRVEIPSLQVWDAMIIPSILEQYKELLETGMWGTAKLSWQPMVLEEEAVPQTPIIITSFEPLQYSNVRVDDYKIRRSEFTLHEWIDVLMQTVGMNPAAYDDRAKLIYISRLVPLVENNVNMMELGPRATGKSFLYKNVSYYVRLYSGGQVSPAVLFYHGTLRTLGDIAVRDAVVFDEVSKIDFKNPDEVLGKFKDYMDSGDFERGQLRKARSTCSLMFQGNIEIQGKLPAEDFTAVMPECMKDSAFVDRVYGMVPGWELPKIGQSEVHLCNGYGLITDYFCEIMHELRKESFVYSISQRVALSAEGGDLSIRDQKAIQRVASGVMKLLSPHDSRDREVMEIAVGLAVEYRQRVHEWLCSLSPGEFKPKKITFTLKEV